MFSLSQVRVIHGYPGFHEVLECTGFAEEFLGLGVADHVGQVVIDCVSFPPAHIEIDEEPCNVWPKRELRGLKADLMMSFRRDHAIARAGDCHF